MMDAFRGSKKIVAGVFALLMLVFVLTSVDLSKFTQRTTVGSINGKRVDVRTYEELVRQQTEQAQRGSSAPLTLEESQRIRDQVWEQLVQNQVLEQEFDRRGIKATDDEVVSYLQSNPPSEVQQAPDFQTNGHFDMSKYQRWLSSAAAQPAIPYLEAQARDQIKRMKLFRVVTADVFTSDPELWQSYRDQHETVKLDLLAIVPRNAIPDSAVSVRPAEVEQYYKAHQQEFKRPETAYLSYVTIPRLVGAADTAAALQHVRELRQEIVGGAPFAEVAKRESADSGTASQGGELGWWQRGRMDPAFDSAAAVLPLNTLSEPVLSSFGYHLIEVEARHGDSVQARHILVPIELSGARRDAFDAKTDTLDRLASEQLDPAALDTAARALGTRVQRAMPVQKGSRVQAGTTVVPDAGVWAFQAKPGELSPIIETSGGLYVFRLDSTEAAGVPPLDKARQAVETALRTQKKWERARALGRDVVARLEAGATIPRIADSLHLPHREVGPFARIDPPLPTPALVGAAFSVPVGQHSGLVDTPDGLYVFRVLEHTPADSAAFAKQLDDLRNEGIARAREARIRNFFTSLRKGANIEDERAELYQQSGRATPQS